MVPVADEVASVPIREQALAVERIEQRFCLGVAGQRLRRRHRDARKKNGAHQQLARRYWQLVEHLLGEVTEHGLHRLDGQRRRLHDPGVLQALQQQHQAGRPAARLLLQQLQARRIDLVVGRGDRPRFVRRESQLIPSDVADQAVGLCTCERSGRVGAAEHDHVEAVARLVQCIAHDRVERGRGAHVLEVVQHQRSARGQTVEECAKEAPREAW